MRGLHRCLPFSPGGSEVRAVCGRDCGLPWGLCRPGLRGKACGPRQNSLCVPPSFRISGAAPGPRHSRYCPLRSSACVVRAGPPAVATRLSGPLVSPPRPPSLRPSLSSRSVCRSALRLWGLLQGLANMPLWPGSGE